MPVTLLNSITQTAAGYPASFTVSAGSNRIAFLVVMHQDSTDPAPATTATLGGQSMTVLATVDSGSKMVMTIFYLLEAGIVAMSGSAFSISGGTYTNRCCLHFSVQGAAQSAASINSLASTTNTVSLSLARTANSYTVGVVAHNLTSTGDLNSLTNPVEVAEFGTTNMDIAYGAETDSARTASFSWSSAFSRENATAVFNIAEVSTSGLTITSVTPSSFDSGIAGIVIAGSGFGASQGSSTVDIGGQAQTVTAWSDTSITITSARGSNSMGAASLKVTVR